MELAALEDALLDDTAPCSSHPVRSVRSRVKTTGRSFFTDSLPASRHDHVQVTCCEID